MEFYLSFSELFSKFPNTIMLVFIPIFIFTILAEALVIQARHGSYSWKNTGVSTLVAVGHVLAQSCDGFARHSPAATEQHRSDLATLIAQNTGRNHSVAAVVSFAAQHDNLLRRLVVPQNEARDRAASVFHHVAQRNAELLGGSLVGRLHLRRSQNLHTDFLSKKNGAR